MQDNQHIHEKGRENIPITQLQQLPTFFLDCFTYVFLLFFLEYFKANLRNHLISPKNSSICIYNREELFKKQHGCNAFIILNKFNEKLFIIPSHPSRSNFPIVLKMSLISWFVLIRSHTQFMHYIYLLGKLGHLSSWRISHTLGLPDCILVLFTCSYVPCISCKLIIRLKGPIRFRFIIRGWCLLLPHITLSVTLQMIPRLRQVRRVSTLTTFYLMVLVLIGNRCQIYYFSQVCKMVSNQGSPEKQHQQEKNIYHTSLHFL